MHCILVCIIFVVLSDNKNNILYIQQKDVLIYYIVPNKETAGDICVDFSTWFNDGDENIIFW